MMVKEITQWEKEYSAFVNTGRIYAHWFGCFFRSAHLINIKMKLLFKLRLSLKNRITVSETRLSLLISWCIGRNMTQFQIRSLRLKCGQIETPNKQYIQIRCVSLLCLRESGLDLHVQSLASKSRRRGRSSLTTNNKQAFPGWHTSKLI